MVAETDDADTRTPLHRRWWFYPAVVLTVFAVLFATMRLCFYAAAEAELGRVRAAGAPVIPAELDAWYPTPAGCNAADDYGDAAKAWVSDKALEERLPGFSGTVDWPAAAAPLPDDMLADTEAYLTANAAALAAVQHAASCPDSRYPVDFKKVYALTLVGLGIEHLSELRESMKLLRLRAAARTERGAGDEAAGDVLMMLHAAASLRRETMAVSALTSVSLDSLARVTLERVLARTEVSEAKLAEVQAAAEAAIDPAWTPRILIGERVIGLELMRRDSAGGTGSMFGGLTPLWRISGMHDLDRAAFLHAMSESIRVAGGPMSKRGAGLDALRDSMPRYAIVARQMAPSSAPAKQVMMHDCFMRSIAAGVAAERFRLAHGRLPASLVELVPDYLSAVPEDPMDGAPLRYKAAGGGAVAYSIGVDGVDQGGLGVAPGVTRLGVGVDTPFTLYERAASRAGE